MTFSNEPTTASVARSEKDREAMQGLGRLIEIMRVLRSPGGCNWDREQTWETLRKFVLEEAQEVVDAIDSQDPIHVCEEVGDLLMMAVFVAQVAAEKGQFTIADSLAGIVKKLIDRHPHVFQTGEDLSPEKVIQRWNDLKVVEKREKARLSNRMEEASSFGSPVQAALQIQKEAARVGFDFPNRREVVAKLAEESREMLEACDALDRGELEKELGDMLFSLINVARLHDIDLEQSLRITNEKFIRRFRLVEDEVEKRGGFDGKSITELDDIWNAVKTREKTGV